MKTNSLVGSFIYMANSFDPKRESSSGHVSSSCVMAWRWSEFRVETSCHI